MLRKRSANVLNGAALRACILTSGATEKDGKGEAQYQALHGHQLQDNRGVQDDKMCKTPGRWRG
jgi:hypothetical protein